MRELVKSYLDGTISRRSFMGRMTRSGFSALAATSALEALSPVVKAAPLEAPFAGESIIPFEGTGGELLAEQLRAAGMKYLFLGNGSGLGALCDALVDRPDMHIILGINENHVVSMADGYAKATGKPSFAMFSRVGTAQAMPNMYNSMKDRTAVVVASDHGDTDDVGRDGIEDVDNWLEAVSQFTKFRWVVEIPERITEWTVKALRVASTMPGGPAHLRLPRNVLYGKVKSGYFSTDSLNIPMHIRPNPHEVEQAARILIESQSPLLYAGFETYASDAQRQVVELAELLAIPVTQARSWSADFPTTHPLFLGEYSTPMRYPETVDAFINLGAHMPDPERFDPAFLKSAKIIHGRVETAFLGTAYPVHVAMAANVREIAQDLVECIQSLATKERLAKIREPRAAATEKYVKAMERSRQTSARRRWDQVPMTWERASFEINAPLQRDAWVVEEFGTQGPKSLEWFQFGLGEKTRIGRTLGRCLGWGVGAATGVKLARPNNQVVCLQGDGGMLFGQLEALWSMSRYDIPITLVIFNNRCYNETRVRMFGRNGRQAQEQKDMLSYLGDPEVNFVQIAGSFGIKGEQVKTPGQLKEAMGRALQTTRDGRPYLIDALVEKSGAGSELDWYPDYSVAKLRDNKV